MPNLLNHDVIVTTYGTLTAEKNRKAKNACDADQPLLAHRWLRVVLDEGIIRRLSFPYILCLDQTPDKTCSSRNPKCIYEAVCYGVRSEISTSMVPDRHTYTEHSRGLRILATIPPGKSI